MKAKISFTYFLNSLLGKEISIPAKKIQYVRLNRMQHTNAWLCLIVQDSITLDSLGIFKKLFNIVVFENLEESDENKTLGLWELSSSNKESMTATFKDVLFIEQFIQKQLNLVEIEI